MSHNPRKLDRTEAAIQNFSGKIILFEILEMLTVSKVIFSICACYYAVTLL